MVFEAVEEISRNSFRHTRDVSTRVSVIYIVCYVRAGWPRSVVVYCRYCTTREVVGRVRRMIEVTEHRSTIERGHRRFRVPLAGLGLVFIGVAAVIGTLAGEDPGTSALREAACTTRQGLSEAACAPGLGLDKDLLVLAAAAAIAGFLMLAASLVAQSRD